MKSSDQSAYLARQEPKTPEVAEEDWGDFCEAVYAAANAHKIPNVYLVGQLNVRYEEGEGEAMTCLMIGDQFRAESMAAWALGNEAQRRRQLNEQLMASAAGKPGNPMQRET